MNTRKLISVFFVLLLLTWGVSCKRTKAAEAEPAAEQKSEEHGADEAEEKSDLDRPVEELMALMCEHKKKMYECDECRYESGFVRAPESLIKGGLLKTAHPELQQVALPVELTGEIQFDERRVGHVSSQVEGVIKKVYATLGDYVKKGQPLLEIESVAIGESQGGYQEAQAMLSLARRNFERASNLRKENISSEKEFLQARQELDSAEIRAKSARNKLTRLGTNGIAGGRAVLRAPLSGTILSMHAVAGEIARLDQSLVTVGDKKAVWIWADLYERDIAAVKKAENGRTLAASVSVKAFPGEEFPGTVDMIGASMDETSRTVKMRVHVKNDSGRLLAGMFANIKLFLPTTDKTLAVPKHAVLTDEGRSFVFVHHHGDYYVRRPVLPGRTWSDFVEIKQGVEPSQTIVVDGSFLLKSDVLRSKMGAGCAD